METKSGFGSSAFSVEETAWESGIRVFSGHGNFDMQAYADYFAGKLEDRELDQKTLGAAFAELPRVAA
jgi:hypothetical protein